MSRFVMGMSFTKRDDDGFNFLEIAFRKLKLLDKGRIVSFREVTRILGVNFHFTRDQTFELLKVLEK